MTDRDFMGEQSGSVGIEYQTGQDYRGLAPSEFLPGLQSMENISQAVGDMVDASVGLDSDGSEFFNDGEHSADNSYNNSMQGLVLENPPIISTANREEYNADTSPSKDLGMYQVEEGLLQQMVNNSPLEQNSDSDASYGG